MKRVIIGIIHVYRWLISPFLPPSCKFTPTCSRYAISAIECHGVARGSWMTIKRLLKCQPFSQTEEPFDPVPDPHSKLRHQNINEYKHNKRVHNA